MKQKLENEENKKICKDNGENKEIRKRIVRIIVLIIIMIILILTSFKSGERFFEIKNANFDESYSKVNSSVAYWYFDVQIKY